MRAGLAYRVTALAVSAFAIAATPAIAGWQDAASQFDQGRLAKLSESRAAGLRAIARSWDLAVAADVLNASTQPAQASALTGHWRCRTIKLGGVMPSVIYSWFSCRIGDKGSTLSFEKTSGSQITSGTLYPDQDGYVYLGASSVKGEPRHRYSGNGTSAGAATTPDDQIGRLSLIDAHHARLELPYPAQESLFDVIELKR